MNASASSGQGQRLGATFRNRLPANIAELASQARKQFVPRNLAEPRLKKKQAQWVKGVYKGNYFRYRIPSTPRKVMQLPKLPQTPVTPTPHAFKNIVPAPQRLHPPTIAQKATAWWSANWAVLILNFGSICTLVGFTRSDVLELRGLSMMGSATFVAYQITQVPRRMAPIYWSSLFATVNAVKIAQILHERNATVTLSERDQQVYQEFFLPHGLTPKQFEILMRRATPLRVPKNRVLVEKDERMADVYLVVRGPTRAHILGRHLTAVSSKPNNRVAKVGGDSGAWIGEMAFLETYWQKEQKKDGRAAPPPTSGPEPGDGSKKKMMKAPAGIGHHPSTALYTITTMDECELLKWTYEDMEALMNRSIDMRGALTRAMTSAIVGKVVNFTVARSSASSNWTAWLRDFGKGGIVDRGVTYMVEATGKDDDANTDDVHDEELDDVDEEEAAILAKLPGSSP